MTQECEKALKVENDRLKKVVQEAQSYRESMQEAIRKTHIQKRKIGRQKVEKLYDWYSSTLFASLFQPDCFFFLIIIIFY